MEAKQKRPDDEFTHPGSPSNASVDDFPLRFFPSSGPAAAGGQRVPQAILSFGDH